MDAVGWAVVALVVVVVVLALVLVLRRRAAGRREHDLSRAEELRGEAASRGTEVRTAARRAQDADVEAGRARAVAQQAEQVAAEAHRELAHELAAQEDAVREADRLDPRVDTRADDYRPITGPDMKASTVAPEPDEARHRAD